MIVVAAILAIASFAVAFRVLGVWPETAATLPVTRRALAVMADGSLDDDAKEREIRAASLRLLRGFVRITTRAAGALAPPTAILIALQLSGLVAVDAVAAFLLRWEVILAAGLAVLAGQRLMR